MRKFIIFLSLGLLVLIIGPTQSLANHDEHKNEITPEQGNEILPQKFEKVADVKESIEWRKYMGLNHAPDFVEQVIENASDAQYYAGAYAVTELEKQELFNRLKNIPKLKIYQKEIEASYEGIIGGVYYDRKTGGGVVMLTEEDEQIKKEILTKYSNLEWRFKKANHTKDTLEEAFNQIKEVFLDNNSTINSIDYSVLNNNITVQSNDIERAKELLEPVVNLDYIIFKNGEFQEKTIYAGNRIQSDQGSCSAGFEGLNSYGSTYIVTAGHCDDSDNWGNDWFDGNGNKIGYWHKEVTSTDWQYSDSGMISSDDMNSYNIRTATSNEIVGQTIYFKGQYSSGNYASYDGQTGCYNGDEGFTLCYSGKLDDEITVRGDSGGTMYTPYYGDGGGYNLKGTLNGALNGVDVYSRIDRIENELDITAVTH